MELAIIKTIGGIAPADPFSVEQIEKLKIGSVVRGEFSKMRDPIKHRRFFALLNIAFDWWEPGELESKHGIPQKNFDRFRKDLVILAGHYEVVIRLDGSTVIEPKSISFGKMDDTEFDQLYSSVIDVIIQRITPKFSAEEIDEMVQRVLDFA